MSMFLAPLAYKDSVAPARLLLPTYNYISVHLFSHFLRGRAYHTYKAWGRRLVYHLLMWAPGETQGKWPAQPAGSLHLVVSTRLPLSPQLINQLLNLPALWSVLIHIQTDDPYPASLDGLQLSADTFYPSTWLRIQGKTNEAVTIPAHLTHSSRYPNNIWSSPKRVAHAIRDRPQR